jgi:hypothetical protein
MTIREGKISDLNIPLAKFTHNLVLRETKIDSIEALKNDLEVSRKWVADIITKKLK